MINLNEDIVPLKIIPFMNEKVGPTFMFIVQVL